MCQLITLVYSSFVMASSHLSFFSLVNSVLIIVFFLDKCITCVLYLKICVLSLKPCVLFWIISGTWIYTCTFFKLSTRFRRINKLILLCNLRYIEACHNLRWQFNTFRLCRIYVWSPPTYTYSISFALCRHDAKRTFRLWYCRCTSLWQWTSDYFQYLI